MMNTVIDLRIKHNSLNPICKFAIIMVNIQVFYDMLLVQVYT